MAIKDRSKNTPKQWEQKRKYDEAFDKLFLSEDFRVYATSILKRCPNGLDLDTCFDDETGEMVIVCRCKIYGYDFSASDRVCGDFYCKEGTTEEMLIVCLKYLKEKDPSLFDEIKDLDMYY